MKIVTKATVFDGGMTVQKENQTVEFVKWPHGNGISILFTEGKINSPELEIAFEGDEIKRILEFLK